MSNERKLLVYRDSKLINEHALKGGAIIIGREDSCHVVLDAESVSRVHAKIVLEEETVYLENQSSTGQLFIDDKQIEMAEWAENQEANVGPFKLKWTYGTAKANHHTPGVNAVPKAIADAAPLAEPEVGEMPARDASSDFAFSGDWAAPAGDAPAEALSLANPEANDFVSHEIPDIESDEEAAPEVTGLGHSGGEEPNDEFEMGSIADEHHGSHVNVEANTKISSGDAVGLLKITQGETIGREIRLDQGFQWIVGRSPKCHVKIDNSKLSRQHFKIVKSSGRYRLQDLGSANGTRLNGIAVTDAPLSPFDTIVAGPVEFQFLVAQPRLENAPALADQPFASHETTQFAPPPMIYSGNGGGNPYEHASAQMHSTGMANAASGAASSNSRTSTTDQPKSLVGKLTKSWGQQTKGKRLMIVAVTAVLVAVMAMPSSDEPVSATATTAEGIDPSAASATAPAEVPTEPRSSNISPEFYLLNPEERRKIEEAYAKAQRARNASDWKEAVDQAKEVLKYVDRYKDVADILAESQTHFNDVILGAVTKDLKNSLDAEVQVQEQVMLLIEAGKKAISEARWTDAQEQCAKAVSLDPRNEEANKCYAAAYGQDANFALEKVPDEVPVPVDPDLDLQAELERELESKKQIYQAAQGLEQDGNLDKALESYKFLFTQVVRDIDGINIPNRFPASVSSSYSEKNTELKTQIEQRMKDIFFQYETDYRSQLVDAEQLVANQDYVRARETYDRILNAAPNFVDVRTKRSELYKRMISEARGIYHEALIYESVGDLQAAIDKYGQTKRLLAGIVHPSADEYFRKANAKLKGLVP